MSNNNWLDNIDEIIFEQGKDPGEGNLRIVGNLEKMITVESGRDISFREIHEIVFGKGTSTFIEQYTRETNKGGTIYKEEQYRIAGMTSNGRPLLVVLTPRDNGYSKRIITAWQISRESKELKKLLTDCPHLEEKLLEV